MSVSAFDAKTKGAIRGLSAADFIAHAGKNSLPVSRAIPIFHNRVLVLVDTANSTMGDLKAIAEMAGNAPPEMPVAFGIFARHSIFTHGFVTRAEDLALEIDTVVEEGSALKGVSDINGALRQGLEIFGGHRTGDTILLVTNGLRPLSRKSLTQLAQEFWRHGVRLVLVASGAPDSGSSRPSLFDAFAGLAGMDNSLIELANRTGGAFMGLMNPEWFNLASDGYILALASPASSNRPLKISIALKDPGVKADLFFPQRIPACSGMFSSSVEQYLSPGQ